MKNEEAKILIVDDSPTQLITLEMALKKKGFKPVAAKNGLEAFNKAYETIPDIIVSDIQMPELNGYQLCRLIKNDSTFSGTKVILLTSLGQSQDRFWGIKAGADKYIQKENTSDFLITEVEKLLAEMAPKSGKSDVGAAHFSGEDAVKARLNQILETLLFESTIISETRTLANEVYDRKNLLAKTFQLLSSLFEYDGIAVTLKKGDSFEAACLLKEGVEEEPLETILGEISSLLEVNKEGITIKLEKEPDKEGGGKLVSSIHSKLEISGKISGAISIFSRFNNFFSHDRQNLLNIIGRDFSTVVHLLELYEENKKLSITDGLTKTYNHRYFKEFLQTCFESFKRYGKPLTLIMLDIDHFKSVNDTYGHQAGDKILIEISREIKKNLRSSDTLSRYGGEEFAILSYDTDLEGGVIVAQKMKEIVSKMNFKLDEKTINVTISLGVATARQDFEDHDTLVKCADSALYRSKENGRNRVTYFSEGGAFIEA